MASNAEILSRGQASRNRQWAGAQARWQRAAQIVLALALAGSWIGMGHRAGADPARGQALCEGAVGGGEGSIREEPPDRPGARAGRQP